VTELWRPAPRSRTAESILAAVEADRSARPERFRLDPDHLASVALKNTDDLDLLPAGWRDGLEQYVASASEDGRLNALGIRNVCSTAIGRLRAGVAMARHRRSSRDAATPMIGSPVVITGGWRTGTTFLFRLLGSDPRLHAPLPAELVSPWLFADGAAEAARTGTSAASDLLHTLNPQMAHVHPSGPQLPEECVLGMGTDLRNWGFTSMMRLPSYADWLAGQDFAAPYQRYYEALQLLSACDERRFVLKAPAHTAELDHLAEAFPGAVVVQIHRDIVQTLASGASLFAVYRSTYSDDVDPVDVGRQQVDQSELWLRRAAAFRASAAASAVTFVDIAYDDLIARPTDVLDRVYQAAGLAPPPRLTEFVAAYQSAHPRDTGAQHRYHPVDFGIDPGEVRERFAFLSGG